MFKPKEIFQEVAQKDIPNVLKALQEDWPKHFLLYQKLSILEKYKNIGSKYVSKWEHTLYLHGDYDNGIYLNRLLIEVFGRKVNYFYIYTKSNDLTELRRSLKETLLLDWQKKDFFFPMINSKFRSGIEEVFALNGVKCEVSKNTMFVFPVDKDIQPKPLPKDVYVDFLNESYAEEMDRNWPHKSLGSVLIHKENLHKMFGLGILRKSDKRLISSALCTYSGGIFVLYSDPDFRGRGFATHLIERMVLEIKGRGYIPFCTVIIGNKASEAVFTKVGFEEFSKADYIWPIKP